MNAGFSLSPGESFLVMNIAGTRTGNFALSEGQQVGTYGGIPLYVTFQAGNGNDVGLFTQPVPEPSTWCLAMVAACLVGLRAAWRRRGSR